MEWETVIGLEVHVQLATNSKIFSGAATTYGASPNSQACVIDLGYPGVLPVLNEKALAMACKFGLAINAEIVQNSVFARKNYFYPDLPKGYQISQHERPIVGKGKLVITLDDGSEKTIGITRAHLEEDAGKSLHEDFNGASGIDFNRAGIPLLEIVSEPDMRNTKEVVAYLKTLHALVRYLEISDGNMQEGSFRCDANVSVRPKGTEKLGTRCEIKNVNSFKNVEKAILFEVQRQIEIIESGGSIVQETRLYDADKDVTRSMRQKEEANDYRYFPDPDLIPVEITRTWLDLIKASLPELPQARKQRFIEQYELSNYDANVLTSSKELADYFESVVKTSKQVKLSANWVMGELLGALNKNNIAINHSPIPAQELGNLVARIVDNTISGKMAKTVFEALFNKEGTTDSIIAEKGLKQVTDSSAITALVEKILAENPNQVAEYKSGKDRLFGFFVGMIMQASKGQANPEQVNEVLKQKLDE